MAELSLEEKCTLAVGLIAQSPPGEVNDVINDIRALIDDDAVLMPHIVPSLKAYNLEQLTVVEHPAEGDLAAHTSVLSTSALVPGEEERYVDLDSRRSFALDHATLAVSDFQPYELPEEETAFSAELLKSLKAYTKNHFPSGHCSVTSSQYPLLPPEPERPVAAAPEPSAEAPQSVVEAKEEAIADLPVADVVPEQIGAGEQEPAPTPLVGDVKPEEVIEEGGLEKVDEKVEEVKEEEESQVSPDGDAEKPSLEDPTTKEEVAPAEVLSSGTEPVIVEETSGGSSSSVVPDAVVPPRKQERLENPTYTLAIVGNRYNPSNFWTGRWRTQWVVDKSKALVEGTINVEVHYYEQGNVQLTTKHSSSFPYPVETPGGQSIPSHIVTNISKIETAYHMELNDVYGELGDKAFRALRRALPVTRQKMDWEKVSGYSLGADLTKSRA